ncbi:MAG: helicase-exonuclease AddAB subunit AddB [Sporolactobacillus sp.]
MTVQFVLGRAGTGKTADCVSAIKRRLLEKPNGSPLIYLVPEHMTFAAEVAFASDPELSGVTRLTIFSFPRLALRVLQQAGGAARLHLDEAGIAMLLRRVVLRHSRSFRLFGNACEQSGFFQLLADTIAEFKQYCLTPDLIAAHAELLAQSGMQQDVADKLHDLALIYQDYEQALLGHYVDGEGYLSLMCDKIAETPFLADAEIWIDGFQKMTPAEQLAVECLMETASRVTILISSDKIYEQAPDIFSPFHHSVKLFLSLKKRAQDNGVAVLPTRLNTTIWRGANTAIAVLNRQFGRFGKTVNPQTAGLRVTEAVNRRVEVEETARQILQLAQGKHLRYRSMTVIVRHLSEYRDLIETIFSDYDIPVFIDQKQPMHHHPLIECIRSALEVVQRNWHYEPVFRCAKTDLFLPAGEDRRAAREGFDQLENYVLAYGLYGRGKWTEETPWTFRLNRGLEETPHERTDEERALQDQLNRTRRLLADPLAAFELALRNANSVADQCAAVYQFLIDLQVPQKLALWAAEAKAGGRLEEAKSHQQVWRAVIHLLDQCAEGAGEETMPLSWFLDVLDTGLDQLQFAQVPPALDQVQVSTLDRLRAADWRAVFLLGINEGVVPAKPVQEGLFSDTDRSLLESAGMHVAEGDEEQMALENEWIYQALTLPSETIFLSYPLASEAGETLKPSPLIGRIRRLFPGVLLHTVLAEPRTQAEADQLTLISRPRKTLSYLAGQIRDWCNGYPISDIWWDSYNWLLAHEEWQPLSKDVLSSLFARNDARLSQANAEQLYGEAIKGSVSRLELVNACPFSQFAAYGLRLHERDVYQLTAPDIGQLFHLAIKQMTAQVLKDYSNGWADMQSEKCDELAQQTVRRLAPQLQRQILTSSGRYHYLTRKLEQVVARVAQVLRGQALKSEFKPFQMEVPFGPGQPIPPLTFQLKNGQSMQIVGRIDRVDQAEVGDRLMLRIVDYKSSVHDLNLNDVYYGLALQMLTYLDVVITHAKQLLGREAEPAGMLYFHVHNPLLRLDEKISSEEIDEQIFKSFRMKGLLLDDQDTLLMMDKDAQKTSSLIAPFGYKQDGHLRKGSSVATAEALQALQHYTQKKLIDAGNQIVTGDISIAPYRLKQRVPCTFCAYRSVCQFDQSNAGGGYRELSVRSDDWLIEKMEEEAVHDDSAETGK